MWVFMSKTENSRPLRWYVLALLVILSIRFILIGILIHNDTSPSLPQDPLQYKIIAVNIYEHGRFTLDVSDPNNHDLLRPPLYPLFLGFFIKMDHSGYLAVFVQQILSFLTTFLVYLLLLYLTKRKNVSALLSLVFFIWPYDIVWSRMTMSEPLFVFLLVASIYVILKRQDRKGDIIAGLLTGAMLLTRVQGLIFLPFIFLTVLLEGSKRRMWLYPLVILLCISPWLIRNYKLTHSITLSSSGELNMIYGGIAGQEALDKLWTIDTESKMISDPYGTASTKDWWSYTTAGYGKMKELIHDGDATFSNIVYKNAVCSSRIWSLEQLDLLFYRFSSTMQAVFSVFYVLFLLLSVLLITFGFYTAIKRGEKRTIVLFILTIGSIGIGSFANMCTAYGRMNIPLIPFLLIAVGLGVEAFLEYLQRFKSILK